MLKYSTNNMLHRIGRRHIPFCKNTPFSFPLNKITDISSRREFSSWFSSGGSSSGGRIGSLNELGDDSAKIEFIRKLVVAKPQEGIAVIEKGWSSGQLPTTEPFVKEYCKAAFAIKRFDNIDMNALSLMLQNNVAGAQSIEGSMTSAQMQQLLTASMMQNRGSASGAGETPDRPLYIQPKPKQFKDQMWKVVYYLC